MARPAKKPSPETISSITSSGTGASVVIAITACSPLAPAPTAAETMLTPWTPNAVPTRPIIPGWSA